MNDFFCIGSWGSNESAVRTAIVRDVVYAAEDANRFADTLFSLRWGVLLGVLPLPTLRWGDEAVLLRARWQAACSAMSSESDGQCTETPSSAPRKSRFDESSSSSDSEEATKPPQRASRPSVTPTTSGGGGGVSNPLRPAAGSRYAHEFHVNAQRRDIRKDLDRLYWDLPPLSEEGTQSKQDIEQLVLCYCLRHECDYRQGLHELAAFFYCTCVVDLQKVTRIESTLRCAFDASSKMDSVLHAVSAVLGTKEAAMTLAYCLFERLLCAEGMYLASWFYAPATDDAEEGDSGSRGHAGIVGACARVQSDLLPAVNPVLEYQLSTVYEIHGATYLIRWLRLLFLREFSLSQSTLVWTVLFADFHARCAGTVGNESPPYRLDNSLVPFMAVSMIEHVADALLLSADTALRALMKYPVQTEVLAILRGAAALACLPELSRALSPPTPPLLPLSPAAPNPSTAASGTPSSTSPSFMPVVERQGHELSAIIQSLESYWFPAEPMTAAERAAQEATYIEAIARLKKVRDVLLYGVDE